jgi:hypothetical protein
MRFAIPSQPSLISLSVYGNHIQAFLDCVLASVEKEKEEMTKEETMEESKDAME